MTSPDRLDELYELASAYLDGETTVEETARIESDTEILNLIDELRLSLAPWSEPIAAPPAEAREQAIAAALAAFDADPSRNEERHFADDDLISLPETKPTATTAPRTAASGAESQPVVALSSNEWTPPTPSLAERLGKPLAIAAGFLFAIVGVGWIITQSGGPGAEVASTAADTSEAASDPISSAADDAQGSAGSVADTADDAADASMDDEAAEEALFEDAMAEDAMADTAMAEDAMAEDAMATGPAATPLSGDSAGAPLSEPTDGESEDRDDSASDGDNEQGVDESALEEGDRVSVVPELGSFISVDDLISSLADGDTDGQKVLRAGLVPILVDDPRFPCVEELTALADPDDATPPLLRFYGDALVDGEVRPLHVVRRSSPGADELRILRTGCETVRTDLLGPG